MTGKCECEIRLGLVFWRSESGGQNSSGRVAMLDYQQFEGDTGYGVS